MSHQSNTILAADLARFIAEKTSHNLFLTGKAGTGKTVFLKDFVKHTKKKVVVLAPTGIAAINANAMTIHSFCRFGLAPCPLGKVSEDNDFVLDDKEEELVRNLDMIIIDEVSMVRADVMDHISEKIRLIRNLKEPFGGVQLLLIGDLYQLPPVVTKEDEDVLKDYYGTNYFFFNSLAIRKVGFETVCLNKVYRQDNPEFVNILNKARVGNVSWYDCNKLNARYKTDFEIPVDEKYITLVAQKKQADAINAEMLDIVDGDYNVYEAEVTGEFPTELYPTSEKLRLKIGTQVMFVKNAKDDSYCNGTIGEVVDLGTETIKVKVGDKTIEVTCASWDNIRYEYGKAKKRIQKETVGSFKQFPLKLAWAITIHKSQGLSFDHAIIDIPRAFAAGQAYVALSRCRSLEGLILKKKLFPDSFFTDTLVSDFYDNVDNAAHIENLAKAVDYKIFEWNCDLEKDAEEDDKNEKNNLPQRNSYVEDEVLDIASDILCYADYWIYHLSLEAGASLKDILEEIRGIVKSEIRAHTQNPYYKMKLYKKVLNEVSKVVVKSYYNESWTLDC